ncbi:hypothetical protein [Brumimicrobium mesophilum]|uniref:hypothetical protein n=1 Tax=Brumimicrobium mesophilum TaxID=392717 RepID=UPI000D1438B1|nr:hypothetical protein [Brumimicrobium mesophilum]
MIKKQENRILLYFQVLALGLILVFSPCSVRNSIQDSLNLTQTGVTNKSKTTNQFEELCTAFSVDVAGDNPIQKINTTPELPELGNNQNLISQVNWGFAQGLAFNHYQSPSKVKDKTPLYLLHQQFKVYLQEA